MMVYNPFQSKIFICTSGSLAVCERDGCKTGGTAVTHSCNTQDSPATPHILSCTTVPSKCLDQNKKIKGFSVDVFSWHLYSFVTGI